MKNDPFYVSTPIYYVNDKPHIGHYYCTVMADAAARFQRLKGNEVIFSTGTDENSQKIIPVAEKEKTDPHDYVRIMSDRWESTWKKLDISFDRFIRTSGKDHRKAVEKLFKRSWEKGDVYKKKYTGLYCVGCERFYKESELENGLCPYHKSRPETVEEENWFFRLSNYAEDLLELFEKNDFAFPESRKNEMTAFIRGGLEDVSISRSTVKWGIPLPQDPEHVFYVWYDALTNYITALEFYKDDPALFEKFWKNSVHLVGKDIFRFHTVLWPAMLLSAGLPVPHRVFGHGFFTVNGEKISKSLGNTIDPLSLSEKYGIDPIRFYMLFEIPFGKDSDFSIRRFEEHYTSYLANDLGNLLNRSVNMIQKYCPQGLKTLEGSTVFPAPSGILKEAASRAPELFSLFRFEELIRQVLEAVRSCNKLIDDEKPWELHKKNEADRLNDLMLQLYECLRVIAVLLNPIMPERTNEIFRQLGIKKTIEETGFDEGIKFCTTPENQTVLKAEPLFRKLEKKKETEMSEDNIEQTDLITFDDFAKVELTVALINEAERVEGTDKLIRLLVNIGSEQRTLVAGIAQHYKAPDLIGKQIIIVKNLKPRKLKGITSQGMLLAARKGDELRLLTVDAEIAPGSSIS